MDSDGVTYCVFGDLADVPEREILPWSAVAAAAGVVLRGNVYGLGAEPVLPVGWAGVGSVVVDEEGQECYTEAGLKRINVLALSN